MGGARIMLLTLCWIVGGCGDLFEEPGPGGGNGAGGVPGDPRFLASCDDGPLDAPLASCRPAPMPSTGDPYADCVTRINQLRWECQCLPPLRRWTEAEGCADQHAEYDSARNDPHAGFRADICSPRGWAQNECPGRGSTEQIVIGCLQSMWDEGPGEPYSKHGHYINMTNGSYRMVACGFHETSDGGLWSVQNFQ